MINRKEPRVMAGMRPACNNPQNHLYNTLHHQPSMLACRIPSLVSASHTAGRMLAFSLIPDRQT